MTNSNLIVTSVHLCNSINSLPTLKAKMWVNLPIPFTSLITFLSNQPTPNIHFIKSFTQLSTFSVKISKPSKMKIQCALLACALVACCYAAETRYTTKYDNIDVDKILTNDRVLTNYIKCLMDEGPCTPEGRELKSELRG